MIGFAKRSVEADIEAGEDAPVIADLAVREDLQAAQAARGQKAKTPRRRSPEEILLAARSVA